MTGQAVRSKVALVGLHVGDVQVPVAAGAARRVKIGQVLAMAIDTGKGRTVCHLLVALQRVARDLVRKGIGIERG